MSMKWHGDRLKKEVRSKCEKNMDKACRFLESEIKKDLSGKSPSSPGEPPGVVTGELRRSMTYEIEKTSQGITGRVGTNKEYAIPLEFGTSRMAARPFVRSNFEKNKKEIAKILTSGK